MRASSLPRASARMFTLTVPLRLYPTEFDLNKNGPGDRGRDTLLLLPLLLTSHPRDIHSIARIHSCLKTSH
jgi:hypothetical protein